MSKNKYCDKNGAVAQAEQLFESSKKTAVDKIEYAAACYLVASNVLKEARRLRWSGLINLQQGKDLAKLSVQLCDEVPIYYIVHNFALSERAQMINVICAVYLSFDFLCKDKSTKVSFQIVPEIEKILKDCSLNMRSNFYLAPSTQAFLQLHLVKVQNVRLKTTEQKFLTIRSLLEETIKSKDLLNAGQIALQLSKFTIGWRPKRRLCVLSKKLVREATLNV
ncbi:MAG: hypothetical protein RLZZ230_340 [Candidatus Parcubacteria bacterium]|jgi:hypothetical protein